MCDLRRACSKLKLITFDVTGTLLHFKKPVGEQYAEVGIKYNVFVDSNLLTNCFSREWKQMTKNHPNFGLSCGMGWESWWHQIVHRTFVNAAPSKRLDEDRLKQISHHLTELYKGSDCWDLCNGTVDILEDLRKRGISVGVISNFDPRLEEVLKNMKLRDYFKFVIASYSAGMEKPDAKIFQLAVSLNNDKALKGYEILHVGNSPTLDIQAALKVGWNTCLVDLNKTLSINDYSSDVFPSCSKRGFHFTVSDLQELKNILF